MARRVFVPVLSSGEIRLEPASAHHLRDVLRLSSGEPVEAFDAAGFCALATVGKVGPQEVTIVVEIIRPPAPVEVAVVVASAVPKGERADWLVEKLSELGVSAWVPLRTERAVVLPDGRGKFERWERLARESARQSGRTGVMRIEPLTPLSTCLENIADSGADSMAIVLSTADAPPLRQVRTAVGTLTLLVGPEGGWSPMEMQRFAQQRLPAARLTTTTLRVETAAVVAAAVVCCG